MSPSAADVVFLRRIACVHWALFGHFTRLLGRDEPERIDLDSQS